MSFAQELFIFLQIYTAVLTKLEYWIQTIALSALSITFCVAIYLIFYKLRSFLYTKPNIYKCCNCKRRKKRDNIPSPPPNENNIASDVINELQLFESRNTEKRNTEELTKQFQKIKSLEQELSNQKLLNHYTELRLKKKEKECTELQTLEQDTANINRQLMDENVSISKKNADLMKYCENKMSKCRNEYEKQQQKLFDSMQKNKQQQKQIMNFKEQLKQNVMYKNECTKLRANINNLKSQIRQKNKRIQVHQTENNSLKNKIETQKHRLNETSQQFTKLNSDVMFYKQDNKRNKGNISTYKDKISELKLYNEELLEENKEIKKQIERFSKQLQQQSKLQNEIIDIQQQLTSDKPLLSTNSQDAGSCSVTAINNAEDLLIEKNTNV